MNVVEQDPQHSPIATVNLGAEGAWSYKCAFISISIPSIIIWDKLALHFHSCQNWPGRKLIQGFDRESLIYKPCSSIHLSRTLNYQGPNKLGKHFSTRTESTQFSNCVFSESEIWLYLQRSPWWPFPECLIPLLWKSDHLLVRDLLLWSHKHKR